MEMNDAPMPHAKGQVLDGSSIEAADFLSGPAMPKARAPSTSAPPARDVSQERPQPPPQAFRAKGTVPAPDHSVQLRWSRYRLSPDSPIVRRKSTAWMTELVPIGMLVVALAAILAIITIGVLR
jgi:hypothetical protein